MAKKRKNPKNGPRRRVTRGFTKLKKLFKIKKRPKKQLSENEIAQENLKLNKIGVYSAIVFGVSAFAFSVLNFILVTIPQLFP